MLRTLAHLVGSDLRLFLRGRLALFWTFAFPLLMLIMQMTLFGGDTRLGPLSLAIDDQDHSPTSLDYVHQLTAGLRRQKSIQFNFVAPSTDAVQSADLVLTIPPGFGANVESKATTRLQLGGRLAAGPSYDAAYGMLRGLSDAYNLVGLALPPRVALPAPRPAPDSPLGYALYLVTGLIGLIVLSTSLMGFAGPLVAARENGMFRLYQLFPLHTGLVVFAWWLSRLAITVLASLAMFLAAFAIYGVRLDVGLGDLLLALAMLVLGTGAFLSVGLVVASVSGSVAAATMLCNLLYFPLLFSGNLMIPIGGLPQLLRDVLDHLPLNALVGSLRRLLTGGTDWVLEGYAAALLLLVTLAGLTVSARRFSWMPRSA